MDRAEFNKLGALIEPFSKPEDLDNFLRGFLNIQLPWDVVDEESTSSALKFIWDVYQFMLTGKGNSKHVVAASRNSSKTLSASIIQFIAMLHFRRECAHIAATLQQSGAMISYLDKHLMIPELAPYRNIDNYRTKQFLNLPANDFTSKSDAKIAVITATKKGANSPRASCIIYDEVELIAPEIISEVAYVADPTRCGHRFNPLFVYLSSRKLSDGPIQGLIETATGPDAVKKRTQLHKWSAVDWMEKCEDTTAQIDKPVKCFMNMESLEVIWGEEDFNAVVMESSKGLYKEICAFEGCRSCPAFIACQGRSIRQKGTSPMLRNREFVGDVLENVKDPSVIIAQTLNLKPETTAIVFKFFSWHRHVKQFGDFYEWVSGKRFNPNNLTTEELDEIEKNGSLAEVVAITPTKADIYVAMRLNGWDISYGVDWGFRPAPAVCEVVGFHKRLNRAAYLHVDYANDYSNEDWARYIHANIWPKYPCGFVAPDMADIASPTYFRKLKMPCIKSKPPLIETGVSQIRGLLWNPATQESHLAILDDGIEKGGNRKLIEAFENWTHKKTPLGYDFEKFEDNKYCDFLDPGRYAIAPYINKRKVSVSKSDNLTAEGKAEAARQDLQTQQEKALAMDAKQGIQNYFTQEFGIDNVFQRPPVDAAGLYKPEMVNVPGQPPPPMDTSKPKKKLVFSF